MSFGCLPVALVILGFLKCYPKIRIDMEMHDKLVDLVGGGFDMAIRVGDLSDSNFFARKLASVHRVSGASIDAC